MRELIWGLVMTVVHMMCTISRDVNHLKIRTISHVELSELSNTDTSS